MCAARSVFGELGYDATTFQAIARRADLTRPAVNHYFASKELLYRAVLEDVAALVRSGVDQAWGQIDLAAQLSAFVGAMVQLDDDDRTGAAFAVTAVLDAARHPELRQSSDVLAAITREFLTRAVTAAIARGDLTTAETVPRLVEMLMAMLWGIGFYVAFVGDHEASAGVVAMLQALLMQELWQLRQPVDG